MVRPRFLVALAVFAAGCAATQAESQVRTRAASDLGCPASDIRVSEELGGRYRALGCGRKAFYRTACDGLSCVIQSVDAPAIPWKDRPDPERTPPR
jgi:hypothetical protein